ncbi:MAG: 30S ribosomal protein S2 [Patescibacteria group bacterium]|nr:MAG: 30S ribosomal protein S2 [Patescibacteria group bacterium]
MEQQVKKETAKKDSTLIEEMFGVGAHFGYSKSRRHPSAKPIMFGVKNNVEIIDLEKTSEYLSRALEFVFSLGKEGKQILFVGGKSEAHETIVAGATSIGMPYAATRWVGGTITNFSEIKKRIDHLEDLMQKKEKGEFAMYTKKERLMIDREIEGLEKKFLGLLLMKQLPAALFIIDSKKEKMAVAETKDAGIPIVSLLNSDCNMKEVDYPIPANDASHASIKFFVDRIVSAYKKGKASQPEPAITVDEK